jgi:hypothetical protein|tara:strand:- start:23841 stop:24056 length:216 start_codon:yes stop_codon:yes gene_type:complete
MPKGSNQLIKVGIHPGTAHELDSCFRLASVCHALVDLLFCLSDEGVEEVVQRILADGLELVRVLARMMPRL